MEYKSTRNSALRLSDAQVIAQGISEEGGLFVPVTLPRVDRETLTAWGQLSYRALAEEIFSLFLTGFSREEIAACARAAYTEEKFGGEEPVQLAPLSGSASLLELWHGPTCAFKDMALQALPQFLTRALAKSAPGREAVILTATSGDTGKAALEGFQDVPGVSIQVFYPRDGVSPMQKLQMATQEGENVTVCAIEGNFDDAQTAVKRIFTDPAVKAELARQGKQFSSANSINWGRLLPQIVYYFYAYFARCRQGALALGEPLHFCVPTGNFGNILAAYYAREMGLPVGRLICASNRNNVLTDFIRTGVYDRRREFFTTMSPSMDILVSSNLERLLYVLSGEDDHALATWMRGLSEEGCYRVGEEVACRVAELFWGGFCNEADTAAAIRETFTLDGVLCDPHTAVAVHVYRQYLEETGDKTPAVIVSTASPFKFPGSVLAALGQDVPADEFAAADALQQFSGQQAPAQLAALRHKPVRFGDVISAEEARAFVLAHAGR